MQCTTPSLCGHLTVLCIACCVNSKCRLLSLLVETTHRPSGENAIAINIASVAMESWLNRIPNFQEHGDTYIWGFQPVFDPLKACHFDYSWNWVHQDALVMYYDIIFSHLTTMDLDTFLFSIVQIATCLWCIKGDTYQLTKQFGQQLIGNTHEVIGMPPVYKDGKS